jgi:transcription elongation factor GreA
MNNQPSYPMTQSALDKLRAELEEKIQVKRPALAARLKSAIEMGDLSENADYIAAKEEQGFLEGRIQELEVMIRYAVIINESRGDCDTVELGCHVTVLEQGEDEPETYMIVGAVEANPREGKISDESPLGRVLVGHQVGDVVRVEAPDGDLVFKIVNIE